MNDIQIKNQAGWNAIADEWFGTTALPEYGCLIPKEAELKLFGDVTGKKLLDIGCGSGHSLLYHARNGASELWGLDLSSKQLENAGRLCVDTRDYIIFIIMIIIKNVNVTICGLLPSGI